MTESTVSIIRRDAQIQLTLGTQIIKQLQDASMYLLLGQPEAEIENFQKQLNDSVQTFEEPWKTHYLSLASLLYVIDEAAKEQGFVDEIPESQAPSLLDS